MTSKEKLLYHQIHPLKIGVDVTTSLITTYFAWHHNVVWFLILFIIPSIIITILLIRYADIERLKDSAFGKYVGQHMTKAIEAIRFAGQIVMWSAAWFHLPLLIVVGFFIIIGGWLNGQFYKRRH
jgi:hypothetical protein